MIDSPATPTRTNVASPSTSSTAGSTARRGVSQIASSSPATAASRTGSLSSDIEESQVARGTCGQALVAPELLGQAARVGAARTAGRR